MTRIGRLRGPRFEHKTEPLLPQREFYGRVAGMGVLALALVAFAMGVGAFGYHTTEGWAWLDASLNASMILTGMGPVDRVQTDAGKLFAIGYALFSGVVFLSVIALVLAPIAHRVLHAFHLEVESS